MSPEVLTFRFADAGDIPNHPTLPLVVLRHALAADGDADALAREIERRYQAHGWSAAWRWGVYPFPHYHSTAHEVLGCHRGTATIRSGGARGETLELAAGDAVVIPAGVGHRNLGSSDDFQVCGGYPAGQEADLIRAEESERHHSARNRIRQVPLPAQDPLFGEDGPLVAAWALGNGRTDAPR